MELFIRNLSQETIRKIDEIASSEELSRNALLLKIINDYVSCKESFIVNSLPKIVKAMVENELERLLTGATTVENNIYISTKRLMETAEKIDNLLLPELKNEEKNTLKNEDILRILNLSDTDNS